MSNKLPFTVIGGYLGAGKTTLLNHLLTNTQGLRIAALVNDFGSINIDADLIRSHAGDTLNLANGCMCCSITDNFAVAVGQIRNRADEFDRIVVEASGVADPGKIAQYGQMYQLPLDGILVVADAEQVRTQAANKYVGDTVMRQFVQADLILLNKTDLVSPEDLASLRTWLAQLAPRTPVIESVQSQVPIEVLLGSHESHNHEAPLHEHRYESHHEYHEHHQTHAHAFETWTIKRSHPLTRQDLDRFAKGLGEEIYRAKGFVYLQDDPDRRYVYQQVGARWSLEPDVAWDRAPQTQLVVIGRRGATHPEAIAAFFTAEFTVRSSLKSAPVVR
jgi:G3E family GTPase